MAASICCTAHVTSLAELSAVLYIQYRCTHALVTACIGWLTSHESTNARVRQAKPVSYTAMLAMCVCHACPYLHVCTKVSQSLFWLSLSIVAASCMDATCQQAHTLLQASHNATAKLKLHADSN